MKRGFNVIALVGFSFGGFLASRAVAFEHRLAALLAIDRRYDSGSVFLSQLPTSLATLFESGNTAALNRIMEGVVNNASTPTQLRRNFSKANGHLIPLQHGIS